jgi:hypothetical protein
MSSLCWHQGTDRPDATRSLRTSLRSDGRRVWSARLFARRTDALENLLVHVGIALREVENRDVFLD